MALQISAFKGFLLSDPRGSALEQVVEGSPLAVTPSTFTGTYTVPDNCRLIRLKGTGTITWPGIATPEEFDGIEFRGVRPGDQFTVA